MKKRDEIENVIFDLDNIDINEPLSKVFINGWKFVLVAPEYFFDDELMLQGLDLLKSIDGSTDDDLLYFYLTEFFDIDNISSCWSEIYNSEVINKSEREQWQFAFSGMYFLPENESWCGIYVDNVGRDFIIIGSDESIINKIQNTFDGKYLLSEVDL